jgi:hypothetical protein
MLRFLATSITLSAGLLLAGFYAFAQDPNSALAQPTFTRLAPTPTPTPVPIDSFRPSSAAPVPYGYVRSMPAEFPITVADDATLNRDRQLSRDAAALVAKYSQAKEAKDKADVERELTKSVADHFTLRQDIREKELLDLEEQLKRLRAVHQQRTAEKERIVTDRVQHLLRESSGLGWGTDSPQSGGSSLWNNSNQYSTPRALPASR